MRPHCIQPTIRWRGKIIRYISWIAGAIFVAALIVLFLHLSANNMEFSRYNTGWNGTSSFFSDLDRDRTIDIFNPGDLAGHPGNTTLLIIAPRSQPTTEEISGYKAFLSEGHMIFLADDFGTGNEILSGIGSHITITHVNLSSLDRQYSDPYMIVAYPSSEESPLALPPDIALNGAAPLDGGSPLILTSVMSWTDSNIDKRLNRNENIGTFPVMSKESIGSGQIVVLSDPSIFTNTMYTQPENANNRNIIHNLTSRDGPVLVDQMNSRTADAGGLSEILHVIRNTVVIEVSLFCLLMLVIAWAWKKKTI